MSRRPTANRRANRDRGTRGAGGGANPELALLAAATCALLLGMGRGARRPASRGASRSARKAALSDRGDRPEQTPNGLDQALDYLSAGQPLALGALGLAGGAALALMLPSTRWESAAFGETRQRVVDAAAQAAHEQLARLRAAREAATEKLKEEAAERRLTPEGLKDLAHELAEAAKEAAAHADAGAHAEPAGAPSEVG